MTGVPAVSVRAARPGDLAAIVRIYGRHVQDGLASFELVAPDEAEMTRRYTGLVEAGYPYLVAERDGDVAGYAYAGAYRPRPAYRATVENSVYVAPEAAGQGIGRALLDRLIAEATALGFRQMVAVIGDSANEASVALHRRCGFEVTGVLRGVGFKFGRWVDSVLMQRTLGEGETTLPGEAELKRWLETTC